MLRELGLAIIFVFILNGPAFAFVSNGLVGWWQFDDGSGTTAKDSSKDFGATENDGTLVNTPTWTSGKIGGALLFNGSTNYVQVNASPVTGYPLTFSVWCKMAVVPSLNVYYLIAAVSQISTENQIYTRFRGVGGGSVWVEVVAANTTGSLVQEAYFVWTADTHWHHFVFVGNSASVQTLYLDGVRQTTSYFSSQAPTPVSLDHAFIGQLTYNSTSHFGYFDGAIDDVRIYNRILSAGEVRDVYEIGSQNYGGE